MNEQHETKTDEQKKSESSLKAVKSGRWVLGKQFKRKL